VNTQIDWDQLCLANGKNPTPCTIMACGRPDGLRSSTPWRKWARSRALRVGCTWHRELNPHDALTIGFNAQRARRTEVMDDPLGRRLLGGRGQYAEQDYADSMQSQSDLNNPNTRS
jgi:hypothetical protein